ncbi:DUF6153 family protein [Streptomyces sp. NPDC057682]|uniref:DUF6153 family protein n=1 Tax=Streptomyces sp. NPDC057682 TaxID=3346210 RepID=UPI003699EABB
MSVTRRATYGRLLLFAALLFGIVTMHTVGHPAEHTDAASMAPAAHAMAPAAAAPETPPTAPAPYTVHGPGAHRPAPDPAPAHGMDPMAVCLAVLGAWGLALLVTLLVTRHAAGRMPRAAGAGSSRLPRPPPPRRPGTALLTDLSVLRI